MLSLTVIPHPDFSEEKKAVSESEVSRLSGWNPAIPSKRIQVDSHDGKLAPGRRIQKKITRVEIPEPESSAVVEARKKKASNEHQIWLLNESEWRANVAVLTCAYNVVVVDPPRVSVASNHVVENETNSSEEGRKKGGRLS